MSHKPMALHGLLQGYLCLIFVHGLKKFLAFYGTRRYSAEHFILTRLSSSYMWGAGWKGSDVEQTADSGGTAGWGL
jgi:hypothetical protein